VLTAQKLRSLVEEEFFAVDWRVAVLGILLAALPAGAAARVRARAARAMGITVGSRTLLTDRFGLVGGRGSSRRLRIGMDCYVNGGCVFDATAPITIGNNVSLGHGVLITTSSHAIGGMERRAGSLEPRPVTVGNGVWLASRVVVLPGVEIGEGAVVCAGAVVSRSVAPHTMVAGVPARVIRKFED
jgi:acetyltransferase-like isoleucine patch superfamily enzyme